MGEDYYPLPWSVLTYNAKLGCYEIDITEQQLKNAPKLGESLAQQFYTFSRQLELAHEDSGGIAARARQASHIALLDGIEVERDENDWRGVCGRPRGSQR